MSVCVAGDNYGYKERQGLFLGQSGLGDVKGGRGGIFKGSNNNFEWGTTSKGTILIQLKRPHHWSFSRANGRVSQIMCPLTFFFHFFFKLFTI